MNYLYKVCYKVLVPCVKPERDMVITAPSPVRALDVFHKNVQSYPSKLATTGGIQRPVLKPEDYAILKLVHRYEGTLQAQGGTEAWIESEFDIPATPNPDTHATVKETPVAQAEMELDDARLQNAFGTDYEKANAPAV